MCECKECEPALSGLSQVVWSEKQMFVLFYRMILHTKTTPSLIFFLLESTNNFTGLCEAKRQVVLGCKL